MIEIEQIENEKTGEIRLYYRYQVLCTNASGALEPTGKWSAWKRVREKTLGEASIDDLIESGGLFQEEEKLPKWQRDIAKSLGHSIEDMP